MRYVFVVAAVVVAVLVGWVAQRRQPDAPVRTGWNVPQQLDRADFTRPDAAYLVAAFTSATCDTCREIVTKISVLDSESVVVQEVEYGRDRALHDRYAIDAVPVVLMANAGGVVQRSFLGPTSAADLWAALAELRGAD